MRSLSQFVLIASTVVVLMLLVGPLVIPVPPLQDTLPPEQLADPDSRFVQIEGLSIHHKVVGQGQPTLLLLHGFGSSVFSWQGVSEPLARLGTVVAFDRPAFGLTERPLPGDWKDENPYGIDAQVRLTVGLLDELSVEKAILVGHSSGGSIAMLTALRHPERVQGLVLVSPAVYSGGGVPSWASPVLRTPQLRRVGPLLVRFLVTRLERALPTAWHDPGKITTRVLAGYKKPLRVENWDRAFWEFLLAGRPLELEKDLSRIAVPTLVITGDDDTWVPTEQSVRLAGELPNAELVVIPNCGHVGHEECPEAFLQAVSSFISKCCSD